MGQQWQRSHVVEPPPTFYTHTNTHTHIDTYRQTDKVQHTEKSD